MTRGDDGRLVGWKAIGAFVGRDERTARRWATERGLPVHRVPGGGSATVWANPDDLRAWMASGLPATDEAAVEAPVEALPPTAQTKRTNALILAACGVALVATTPFVWQSFDSHAGPTASAAPYGNNKAANDQYREASYGLHQRSVAGLIGAAETFGKLADSHPRNPAAFVGLAEANLLLREFNSLPNEIAYRRAAKAAEQALKLDPKSAPAARALGFVRYFGDGQRKEGLALLERALALDPSQAQSHHWHGTALLGEGRVAEATKDLAKARELDPASSAICADAAYAQYLAGERTDAIKRLNRIVEVDPVFSGAYRYLARFYLIEGRDADYLKAAAIEARLRVDPAQVEAIKRAEAAFKSRGRKAMVATLIAHETAKFQQTGESAIKVAMMHAAAGDAAAVKLWLDRAESIREPEIRAIAAFVEFVPYRDKTAFVRYFKTAES